MKPPFRPSEPESPFEHPAFEGLYGRVLRDVADRRLEPETRKAAARALAFLLRERLVDETVATDVLAAVHRSVDLPMVVRTLMLGLRDALGDHEKIAELTRTVVDRALREDHMGSFTSAMRILVELGDYYGTMPTRWRLSLLRATKDPERAPRVFLFAHAYKRRFPAESWPWIQQARRQSTIALLRRRVTVAEMREARES